jgi:DNA-binding NarL/FixJ family response regulator
MDGAAVRTANECGICDHPGVATRVLIVDDHPSFRASARAILEADGFDVIGEAGSGASALEAIQELGPDVVLLDVQLPDMTGFDICRVVEGTGDGPGPAIVLVSSRDVDDFGELVDSSCARGFVAKADLSGEAIAALIA